jgi:hypothetical protein
VHPEAPLQFPPEDPGTYGDHHGFLVHLDHGIQALEVEHDTSASRQRTPTDARAAAVRYDGDTPLKGRLYHLGNFRRRRWAHNNIRAYNKTGAPTGRPQGQRISIPGIGAQYVVLARDVLLANSCDEVLFHSIKK